MESGEMDLTAKNSRDVCAEGSTGARCALGRVALLLPFCLAMSRQIVLLAALLGWTAAAPGQPPRDSWSLFRGGGRLWGVADTRLPDTLKLRWTYQAKESIESSAAIADGVAYVG